MRVFISSVTNFVGSNLCEGLVETIGSCEIFGTSSVQANDQKRIPKGVVRIVDRTDLDEIRRTLLQSDVIIYNLVTDVDQAKIFLQEFSEQNFEDEKLFICLSTLLTWAKTLSQAENEQDTFTEEDYRRRKAHPNYKKQIFVEKMALRIKKANIRTKVVSAGLIYGEGESTLDFLFKRAWYGESLPIIGVTKVEAEALDNSDSEADPSEELQGGNNVIPSVHIKDLAQIVSQIVQAKSAEDNYVLAVDASNNTITDIVKAISSKMGAGAVHGVSFEEALLLKDTDQYTLDLLSMNLPTESIYVNELNVPWRYENGLVENISGVVNEYREKRGLTPLRMLVHGPPLSGKTTVAKQLASYYGLHYIHIKDVLENADKIDDELAKHLSEKKEDGKADDTISIELLRKKLGSWECQNQGYVLDGYPMNTAQAENLFPIAQSDEIEGSTTLNLPEFVIVLEATDEFLKDRVLNMDESQIVSQGYDGNLFVKSLAAYRDANTEDKTVLNFFEEREQILPILLQSTTPVDQQMDELYKIIGAPHNFGPSVEELEAKRKQLQLEEAGRKVKQEAERQQQEAQEKLDRDKREHEWAARIAKLEKEERDVLELQSAPFRSYLMENIMPTLTNGLIELCKVRPQDPVDYLAEYLFRHSAEE